MQRFAQYASKSPDALELYINKSGESKKVVGIKCSRSCFTLFLKPYFFPLRQWWEFKEAKTKDPGTNMTLQCCGCWCGCGCGCDTIWIIFTFTTSYLSTSGECFRVKVHSLSRHMSLTSSFKHLKQSTFLCFSWQCWGKSSESRVSTVLHVHIYPEAKHKLAKLSIPTSELRDVLNRDRIIDSIQVRIYSWSRVTFLKRGRCSPRNQRVAEGESDSILIWRQVRDQVLSHNSHL